MVKIGLQLKAFLENVTGLIADGEDFRCEVSGRLKCLLTRIVLSRWYLKLKCANCGEIPEKWQYVDQIEKQPLKGGRGEACAVMKCKVTSNHSIVSLHHPHLHYNYSSVAERTPSISWLTPSPVTT